MESQNAAFHRTGAELLKRLKPLSERTFTECGTVIDGTAELTILQDEYGSQYLRSECADCHAVSLTFVYPNRLESAIKFVLKGDGRKCIQCQAEDREVFNNFVLRENAPVLAVGA